MIRHSLFFSNYRLIMDNFDEMNRIIYTPTVGWACSHWSHLFRTPRGMYISAKDKGKEQFYSILLNFAQFYSILLNVTQCYSILLNFTNFYSIYAHRV